MDDLVVERRVGLVRGVAERVVQRAHDVDVLLELLQRLRLGRAAAATRSAPRTAAFACACSVSAVSSMRTPVSLRYVVVPDAVGDFGSATCAA